MLLLSGPGKSQGAAAAEQMCSDDLAEYSSDLGLVARNDFFKEFGR
jgi:hypothetical protein